MHSSDTDQKSPPISYTRSEDLPQQLWEFWYERVLYRQRLAFFDKLKVPMPAVQYRRAVMEAPEETKTIALAETNAAFADLTTPSAPPPSITD